jgi:hypothetical protein
MTFLLDTFAEASDTLLDAHTSDSGHAWTELGFRPRSTLGSAGTGMDGTVNGGILKSTSTSALTNIYRNAAAPPTADYEITLTCYNSRSATFLNDTNYIWTIGARLTDTGTASGDVDGYFAGYRGDSSSSNRGFYIAKLVGGVWTDLGFAAHLLESTGAFTMRFVVSDTEKTLYHNGSPVLSDTTDNSITQVGRAGVGIPRSAATTPQCYITQIEAADIGVTSAAVEYAWQGAVTDDGFTVAARVTGTSPTRIVASTASDLSSPVYGAEVTPSTGEPWVKPTITGLTPGTTYYWGLQFDQTTTDPFRGEVRLPAADGSAFSFSFAAGSCQNSASTANTFARILARNPLFMLHMGDFQYGDITSNNEQLYRDAYTANLATAEQSALYADVPVVYMWDDHDYAGNNSDGTATSRPAALAVHLRVVPHCPISLVGADDDTPLSHTFTIGRVQFFVLDTRSERDTGTSALLGSTQLTWLLDQIAASTAEMFVIQCAVPWISTTGDSWYSGSTERTAIADALESAGMTRRTLLIHGDGHMVAMDDGTNSDYTTGSALPLGPVLFCFAPLDRPNSTKGGPYSEGTFIDSTTQYGIVDITDDGSTITVTGTGYRADTDAVLVTHSFAIDTTSPTSGLTAVAGTLSTVGGVLTSA